MSRCKICNNKRVHAYNSSPKGRARHRQYQLARTYGITVQQYEALVREQDGRCAICKREPMKTQRRQFYVDHDHATNQLRGLLCGSCNSGLGMFRDCITTLKFAVDYLRK